MADVEKIDEAREAIAEAQDAIGDAAATAAHAETVIEEAEARAEAAEEMNELLAEAALRDALSKRIEDFIKECDTWRNAADLRAGQIETQLAEIRTELASMSEKLQQPVTVTVATPAEASSIPQVSEAPAMEPVAVVTVEPGKAAASEALTSPAAPRRKRNFL